MIRNERFIHSRHGYAVDLSSFREGKLGGRTGNRYVLLDAVWYRGTVGFPKACMGTIWDYGKFEDARDLLANWDGRYGGNCQARWDGAKLWGPQAPAAIEEALSLLRPMLAAYPAIPDGYDGWWEAR